MICLCNTFGFNNVYCRLDITAQFVSVWLKTLQTTWIILMERNVCILFDMFPLLFMRMSCFNCLHFAHGYSCIVSLDQRALGMSMRVERASLQQVQLKIAF